MKYFKEVLLVTLIGQGIVWSVVFLSSLLPSFVVGALIGFAGYIVGKMFYLLIEERI